MLLSFEFENFKSFKDANVLDLTAAKITDNTFFFILNSSLSL